MRGLIEVKHIENNQFTPRNGPIALPI